MVLYTRSVYGQILLFFIFTFFLQIIDFFLSFEYNKERGNILERRIFLTWAKFITAKF